MKPLMLLTLLAFTVPRASAGTPREDLASVVAQVKAKPADRSLREKAIALARKVKPAVPADAKRAFVMGGTYQKEAKQPSDFTLAIDSFQDALKAAPWWGDAYYNLSVSLESAGRLDEAKDALELYLLTKPKDAEAAQNRVYALEAKRNMTTKQAVEAVKAATAEADAATAKVRAENSIEGAWRSASDDGTPQNKPAIEVTRSGGSFNVKPGNCATDSVKKVLHTDETSLRYTCVRGDTVETYDLHLEGSLLVGTLSVLVNGSSFSYRPKFIRIP